MRIGIVGSRKANERVKVDMLRLLPADVTEIVSGGAEGVDTYAAELANTLGIPVRNFLPDYDNYGKKAPLVRNLQIVDYADEILAFWDGRSNGTRHTIAACIQKGKPVRIIPLSGEKDT